MPSVPPARDHAGGELDVVAGPQHRVERDDAHQHDHGADQTAGDAPERADDQRRDRERGRHAAERELDRIEHLVDQRAALHHVAHQHEQRDGDQDVVGHRAVGALDHQIEDAVVPPVLAGIVERDEAEKHPEAHQREGRREAHHDHDHDEHEHQQPERGVAHVLRSPPMPALARHLLDLLGALDRQLAGFLVDVFAVRRAAPRRRRFPSTSFSRLGHTPVRMQTTQRTISATPCSITSAPAIGMTNLNW